MTELQEKKLESSVRSVVGRLYIQCFGAYGAEYYEGECEPEVQNLLSVLKIIV